MAETWKTLAYPLNKYEVSDLGRVRNINSGIFLTPYRDKKTWSYRLYPVKGKKQVKRSAAKLVWCAFMGPVPRGWFVQFKDKNRRNLALKNLYLKSSSDFRKEEYAEGRSALLLDQYESEFDEWIFPHGA